MRFRKYSFPVIQHRSYGSRGLPGMENNIDIPDGFDKSEGCDDHVFRDVIAAENAYPLCRIVSNEPKSDLKRVICAEKRRDAVPYL